MYYIHKFAVAQQYGGPEEGGWWFTVGNPVDDWKLVMIEDEENANEICRALNFAEYDRRDREEEYDFTSVLSYKSDHFEYDVSESPVAEVFPAQRPHYE